MHQRPPTTVAEGLRHSGARPGSAAGLRVALVLARSPRKRARRRSTSHHPPSFRTYVTVPTSRPATSARQRRQPSGPSTQTSPAVRGSSRMRASPSWPRTTTTCPRTPVLPSGEDGRVERQDRQPPLVEGDRNLGHVGCADLERGLAGRDRPGHERVLTFEVGDLQEVRQRVGVEAEARARARIAGERPGVDGVDVTNGVPGLGEGGDHGVGPGLHAGEEIGQAPPPGTS